MTESVAKTAARPLHSRSPEHLRNLLAFRVDSALDRLRTSAVLERYRWWRPSWQAGYDQGLREAHEAAQRVMLAAGARWPADPLTTENAASRGFEGDDALAVSSKDAPKPIACQWCGRAIDRDEQGRWYAVKGKERGYDPLACDASDDGTHDDDKDVDR